jgi:hypothetical protein
VKDTTPETEQFYRELLLSRPNAERLRMGCEMFEAAKALALAGLRERGDDHLQERLFLRLYGTDFSAEECERILVQIRKRQKRA